MDHLLEVTQISKQYGASKALDDVSLKVPKGSVFGILGPNGAGKTTLLRIINQIIIPDSGIVKFDNEPLSPSHIRSIGYLPEERGLYKSMKVGEQILYLAQLKGLHKIEAQRRLKYWFAKFEMDDWWNKKIQELSKGMAQKIQFIVTVLHQPKLLIFDEPFSGFDPVNAIKIKDEILTLRDQGATVIFSTHRMETVEELCDHIVLLNHSNKILGGKLSDLKQQFSNNIFELSIVPFDKKHLIEVLKQRFKIEIKAIQRKNQLDITCQLPQEVSSNTFLRYLTDYGQIISFNEVTPSVHEIFVKAVTSHE